MMIGKWSHCHKLGAISSQSLEELLGAADSGKCHNTLARERAAFLRHDACAQSRTGKAFECWRAVAHENDGISSRETLRHGFAQWSGRQQPAIAESVLGIHSDE